MDMFFDFGQVEPGRQSELTATDLHKCSTHAAKHVGKT